MSPQSPAIISVESAEIKLEQDYTLIDSASSMNHHLEGVEVNEPGTNSGSKEEPDQTPEMDIGFHKGSDLNDTLETTDEGSSGSSDSSDDSLKLGTTTEDIELFDSELDAAVKIALQSVDSNSVFDEDDDDDASVASSIVSSSSSVNSVKSAVQLRLESRKKAEAPSKESFDAKLQAATQRKLYFLQELGSKRKARLEKVSSVRSLVEDKNDAEVNARQKSLSEKLSNAMERKQYFLDSKTDQVRSRNNRALSARSILDQQKEEEAAAIREKLETKLREASEKKESDRLRIVEKVQAKFAKISENKDKTEQSIREMGERFAKKLAAASSRKSLLDLEVKEKVEDQLSKKQEATMSLLKSKDANVSSKKLELEDRQALAAERKQALLDAKKAKVAKYLARAYERGQEAIKRKEEMSLNGDDLMINMSLSSIKEDQEVVERDEDLEKLALQWLDDENSVASFSTTGSSKSRVQTRLESYTKSSPSKDIMEARLEAAQKRREESLSTTKEKAGFSAKMDKVSQSLQAAESKVVSLSKALSDRMLAASMRRENHMEKSVRGKVAHKNMKLEKAKGKQVEKDAKVSQMQKNLEKKLLAALERKEAVVAARAAKASGDISVSSTRGKTALEKKELMMIKIRKKSERKLDTASKRRKQLRALEKRKKEVMMMRREMTKAMNADEKLEDMQKRLSNKLSLAQERKDMFIQAKKAKAAEYGSSALDRGEEITKERESSDIQQKTKLEEKLEAAAKRKAELEAKAQKKKKDAEARRQRARELGRQRKIEREQISEWEEESLSPPSVVEDVQDFQDVDIGGTRSSDDKDMLQSDAGSYEEKRLMAKQQLMDEIQLANEAKRDEFIRITKEMKKSTKPRAVQRDMSTGIESVRSFGSIETSDQLSFDEGEVSICGLSTVREEQKNVQRRKAQTALALAELDVKLSEIQLMQAILLAEEASLSGVNEFRTTDQSIEDLNRAKGAQELMKQKRSQERKKLLKERAKQFFNMTMTQAKAAKERAGRTIEKVKLNIEKHEKMEKNNTRPTSAPSKSLSVF